MSRLAKEGIWVRGSTNNVDVDIFVDTGVKYMIFGIRFAWVESFVILKSRLLELVERI